MTDLINNTTAMPAVLWTHWMNESTKKQTMSEWKETEASLLNEPDIRKQTLPPYISLSCVQHEKQSSDSFVRANNPINHVTQANNAGRIASLTKSRHLLVS